jgi:hypothetical protein
MTLIMLISQKAYQRSRKALLSESSRGKSLVGGRRKKFSEKAFRTKRAASENVKAARKSLVKEAERSFLSGGSKGQKPCGQARKMLKTSQTQDRSKALPQARRRQALMPLSSGFFAALTAEGSRRRSSFPRGRGACPRLQTRIPA